MATRQKTSSSKNTRKQPATRSGSTRASSAKKSTATKRTSTTKTTRSAAAAPQPGVLRHLVDGHGHDLWGVAALILAVLVGVGVYADAGGVVGSSLGDLAGSLVGRLDILIPPALAALGVVLIRGPAIVNQYEISIPGTPTAPQIAAAYAALLTLGILVR